MKLAAATAIIAWLAAAPTSADPLAEHDFVLNCAGCHKMSGAGSAIVPSLHDMNKVVGTAGSRAYLVQVPGVAHAPLSDARLATLVNWLVERFTGHPPTPAYTAIEVSALRKTSLLDPLAERARLLSEENRATTDAKSVHGTLESPPQQ